MNKIFLNSRRRWLNEGGDGGAGAGAGGGAGGGANDRAPIEFSAIVPAEFKDAPWVKETKDIPSLFKRTGDLISELGKRPTIGIPKDDAKPDEIAAFNKAWGVPEKPEAYVFADPPKELGAANPEFQGAMKAMFHKNGISAKQAAGLQKDWGAMQLAEHQKKGAAEVANDEGFVKLKTEVFGNRADEAVKGAGALIAKFAPASVKAHVDKLSNENLIVLATVIDGIRKEYIPEDKMPAGGGPPAGETFDQKRERAMKLMASEPYTNKFHADHEKTKAEVDAIYAGK